MKPIDSVLQPSNSDCDGIQQYRQGFFKCWWSETELLICNWNEILPTARRNRSRNIILDRYNACKMIAVVEIIDDARMSWVGEKVFSWNITLWRHY